MTSGAIFVKLFTAVIYGCSY